MGIVDGNVEEFGVLWCVKVVWEFLECDFTCELENDSYMNRPAGKCLFWKLLILIISIIFLVGFLKKIFLIPILRH